MSYPEVDFLYLNEQDMIKAGVEDMPRCIETMEEMLKLMKIGDFRMGGQNGNSHGCMVSFPAEPAFPEMPKDGPDRRFMAMPAYLGGSFDMAGVKWYGSNAENRKKGLPRSILMLTLNDKDTGAPLAYMSANILSAYRTGAIPGVGFKYLAPADTRQVGIVGPGVMSRTAFDAMMAVRPMIETVKVKGRGKKNLDKFVDYVHDKFPSVQNVEIVESIEDATRDSDILYISTSAPSGDPSLYPYVAEDWIKPGALLCTTAAMRLDEDFLIHRARTVTDNVKLYEAWEEEYAPKAYNTIPIPGVLVQDLIAEGKMTSDQVIDLPDILMGNEPAIRDPKEVTVYSVGGMPIEDVAWGTVVYRNALEQHIGTSLNLWNQPALA